MSVTEREREREREFYVPIWDAQVVPFFYPVPYVLLTCFSTVRYVCLAVQYPKGRKVDGWITTFYGSKEEESRERNLRDGCLYG